MLYLCTAFERKRHNAEIAQLVEHNLAKVGVASSSLVRTAEKPSRLFLKAFLLYAWYDSLYVYLPCLRKLSIKNEEIVIK